MIMDTQRWNGMNKERVCMNPDCKDCDILKVYKCTTDRPIVYLAKTCWNCGKSEFLEGYLFV